LSSFALLDSIFLNHGDPMQRLIQSLIFIILTALSVSIGLWMGDEKPANQSPKHPAKKEVVLRQPIKEEAPIAVESLVEPAPEAIAAPAVRTLDEMVADKDVAAILKLWAGSRTVKDRQVCAQALALIGTPESVDALLSQLLKLYDPAARKSIAAASMRTLTSVEALPSLLNLLSTDSKTHAGLAEEVMSAIGRLAQADTADSLGALHSQLSNQPVQSERLLQTISGIRSETALPGLLRLAKSADQDKPAAAAALSAMNVIGSTKSAP
jgi:hypothetical protein